MCIYLGLNCCAEYLYPPSRVQQVLFVCFKNNYGHSSKIKSKTGISNMASITSLDAMLSELVYLISVQGCVICSDYTGELGICCDSLLPSNMLAISTINCMLLYRLTV